MDVSLLHEAIQALTMMTNPMVIGFLLLGVLIGLMFGAIPGLGGLIGLTLLLPFTFDMSSHVALAFLMGLSSIIVTSDTIPAVLFGVPGSVGSAATVLDGYPMARNGQASRAFGAAFTSSVIGGLWGALVLAVSIPILRPILLHIGSPELFAFCIFGLSLAAVLSGGSPLKGLAAATIGILLATIGDEPITGTLRWTFGSLYLWDGLPIVPIALGLFAIPEIADLVIERKPISRLNEKIHKRGQIEGARDVARNWFLVVRSSTIGSVLGAIPGIGASIIDWVAYGHAARTEKNADKSFGSGDVRGVIASESSNNAKEGGALIPTIAFGVPGSASMALILGALMIQGIVPGPAMLTKSLDVTYTLVWSIAFANIFGAGICFLFANQMAKIANIEIGILAPLVLSVVFIGAFQASTHWGDLFVLMAFGVVGFIMKRLKWPRPPLMLGFVLGGLVERYLFISVERYGVSWLWDNPIVIIMLAVTAYGIFAPQIKKMIRGESQKGIIAFQPDKIDFNFGFAAILASVLIYSLFISYQWMFAAMLIPQLAGYVALSLLVLLLISHVFYKKTSNTSNTHMDIVINFDDLSTKTIVTRTVGYFGWLTFLMVSIYLVGMLPALFMFVVGYMHFSGKKSCIKSLLIGTLAIAFCYVLFQMVLIVPWPASLVGDIFPDLRAMTSII